MGILTPLVQQYSAKYLPKREVFAIDIALFSPTSRQKIRGFVMNFPRFVEFISIIEKTRLFL
jgi:hypothetical protein